MANSVVNNGKKVQRVFTVATSNDLALGILGFIKMLKANALGGVIVARTEPKLLKGTAKNRTEAYKRFYDEANNRWRVAKQSIGINVTFQRDYTASCENRSDNPLPYIAEKPKGRAWVDGAHGILLVSDKDPNKFYLRISENKNTRWSEPRYFIDGREATSEEVTIIKSALSAPPSGVCKKQLAYGISADNQVKVKDFGIDTIQAIKFGQKILKLA